MAEAPNADQMAAFAARGADGPVVMLNLLKFKRDGGAEMYARYAAAAAPLVAKVGGELMYGGQGAELVIGAAGQDWDLVALVRYPNRRALLTMAMSRAYREIQHLRDESLERSVLMATDPVSLTTPGE